HARAWTLLIRRNRHVVRLEIARKNHAAYSSIRSLSSASAVDVRGLFHHVGDGLTIVFGRCRRCLYQYLFPPEDHPAVTGRREHAAVPLHHRPAAVRMGQGAAASPSGARCRFVITGPLDKRDYRGPALRLRGVNDDERTLA